LLGQQVFFMCMKNWKIGNFFFLAFLWKFLSFFFSVVIKLGSILSYLTVFNTFQVPIESFFFHLVEPNFFLPKTNLLFGGIDFFTIISSSLFILTWSAVANSCEFWLLVFGLNETFSWFDNLSMFFLFLRPLMVEFLFFFLQVVFLLSELELSSSGSRVSSLSLFLLSLCFLTPSRCCLLCFFFWPDLDLGSLSSSSITFLKSHVLLWISEHSQSSQL